MFNDINSIASLVSIDVTSHTAIPPFVKDCNNCSSGFMFANAECTSTATARLVKPRLTLIKAPESETQGVFVRNDYVVLLKGDHVAARLLAQIVYWYQPNEKTGKPKLKKQLGDKFWIAKTAAEWEIEISLTRRQVDRSKAILESMGIISTHSSGFAGDRSTYYRLNCANGGDHLKEVPTAYALVGAYDESTPYAPVGASISTHECTHKHLQVHSNTEDYLQETTNKKVKTYKKANMFAGPAKAIVKTEVLQAKATPPVETTPVKQPEPIAKPFPEKYLDMPHYFRLAKTHDMDLLLQACIKGGFVHADRKMLSDPECSILERIEIENTLDDSLEELIGEIGSPKDWELFIDVVLEAKPDLSSVAHKANLEFFKKHFHFLLEIIAQVDAKKAAAVPAPVELKGVPVVVTSTATASLETGCPVIENVLPLVPEVLPSFEDCQAFYLKAMARVQAEAAKTKQKAKHYHA